MDRDSIRSYVVWGRGGGLLENVIFIKNHDFH